MSAQFIVVTVHPEQEGSAVDEKINIVIILFIVILSEWLDLP